MPRLRRGVRVESLQLGTQPLDDIGRFQDLVLDLVARIVVEMRRQGPQPIDDVAAFQFHVSFPPRDRPVALAAG